MKEEIFDHAFYELELFTNKYIAFAVRNICLSKYIEKTTKCSSQTIGECVRFNCPLCGGNCYLYVNDINGTFYTTKCNTSGNIFSLKKFFEKKPLKKYQLILNVKESYFLRDFFLLKQYLQFLVGDLE